MRRSLTLGTKRLQLLRRSDRRPDDKPVRFGDVTAARLYIRRLGLDPTTMSSLRRVAANSPGVLSAGATDDEVIDWLAIRLHRRQLYLLDLGERRALAAPAGEDQPEEGKKPAPPPPIKQKTHWIKFKIQDEVTGQPMPNVTMQIRLPNNSLVNRTTNAAGMIEIVGLASGTCDVEQVTDSDALAITKVQ